MRAYTCRIEHCLTGIQIKIYFDLFIIQSRGTARGSLILAGYYRHHRGEWRKRGAKIDCSTEQSSSKA